MKKITQIVVALAVTAVLAGCATPYMIDRRRDAADIFTFSTGYGGGVMARVGPVGTGLCMNFPVHGLRAGEWLTDDNFSNRGTPFPRNGDTALLLIGGQEFGGNAMTQERGKITESLMLGGIWLPAYTMPGKCNFSGSITGAVPRTASGKVKCSVIPYLTQIEVIAGFERTIHVGFNLGELVDFAFGWTTIDIFNDDLEVRRLRKQSNQPAHATGIPAPDR